jgi:hypothetical protein
LSPFAHQLADRRHTFRLLLKKKLCFARTKARAILNERSGQQKTLRFIAGFVATRGRAESGANDVVSVAGCGKVEAFACVPPGPLCSVARARNKNWFSSGQANAKSAFLPRDLPIVPADILRVKIGNRGANGNLRAPLSGLPGPFPDAIIRLSDAARAGSFIGRAAGAII